MLDASTTATKLMVFMHCVGMLVEIQCPLLLCQLRVYEEYVQEYMPLNTLIDSWLYIT